jgi:hypothetical protein
VKEVVLRKCLVEESDCRVLSRFKQKVAPSLIHGQQDYRDPSLPFIPALTRYKACQQGLAHQQGQYFWSRIPAGYRYC